MPAPATSHLSAEEREKRIVELVNAKPDLHSDVHNVFYESKKNPYSHFPRQATDGEFQQCVTNKTSILVYGGSYTGKTFLVTHNLKEVNQKYIKIDCFENMTIDQVYAQMLKNIGYLVETSFTTSTNATTEVTATGKANLFDFASFEESGTVSRSDNTDIVRVSLPLSLTQPNDIVNALRGRRFSQYIVLGMFNKLPIIVQNTFLSHLDTFLNTNIKLIILYTGTDINQFEHHLERRSTEFVKFNQDEWSDDDLEDYIKYCSLWLNIKFSDDFVKALIEKANRHFRIVRKACHVACLQNGVFERQEEQDPPITIGTTEDAENIIKSILINKPELYSEYKDILKSVIPDDDQNEFDNDLTKFAKGLRNGSNHLYGWILFPVITATPRELQYGIPQKTVVRKIRARHDKEPKQSTIVEALEKIEKVQKQNCRRVLLAFVDDGLGGHVLRVVDKAFRVWLFFRDREELCNKLDLPTDLFDQK